MSMFPDFLRHKETPPIPPKELPAAEMPLFPRERPPRRYLTEDNFEWFMICRKPVQVRIRLWRGPDACPVALVSQVDGQERPRAGMSQVANYILESYLQYSDMGVLIFEDSVVLGKRYLTHHSFEYFGCQQRLRLYKPEQHAKEWSYLCWVLQDADLQR